MKRNERLMGCSANSIGFVLGFLVAMTMTVSFIRRMGQQSPPGLPHSS